MDTHKDRALLESVRKHIMQDQRLAGQPIIVSSNDGYIQLSGYARTDEDRKLAINLAGGVVGVCGVEDHIEVKINDIEENED